MDFGSWILGLQRTPNNVGHARPEIPSRICVKEEIGGVIFSRKSWGVPLNWIFLEGLGMCVSLFVLSSYFESPFSDEFNNTFNQNWKMPNRI